MWMCIHMFNHVSEFVCLTYIVTCVSSTRGCTVVYFAILVLSRVQSTVISFQAQNVIYDKKKKKRATTQTSLGFFSRGYCARLCLTLCDPVDCVPPDPSVHEDSPTKIRQWVAMSSSRGSSQPRDQTQASCTAGGFFTIWAKRADRMESSKEPEPVPSTSGISDIAVALSLLLLTILQLHQLSPPLLLQSVTLLACSQDASPCSPAVVLCYCTFQGTLL